VPILRTRQSLRQWPEAFAGVNRLEPDLHLLDSESGPHCPTVQILSQVW